MAVRISRPAYGGFKSAATGSSFVVVKVFGVKEAIAKFRRVGQLAARDLGVTTYQTAQHVQQVARGLVPYVTGALHDGIEIAKGGVYNWTVTASSVAGGAEREYAAYVEYGTWKMGAQPYLRPAVSQGRTYAQARMAALAAKISVL